MDSDLLDRFSVAIVKYGEVDEWANNKNFKLCREYKTNNGIRMTERKSLDFPAIVRSYCVNGIRVAVKTGAEVEVLNWKLYEELEVKMLAFVESPLRVRSAPSASVDKVAQVLDETISAVKQMKATFVSRKSVIEFLESKRRELAI